MSISALGLVAAMGFLALLAGLSALLILWVAAVVRWLDLDKADFSVGHKGLTIHMERGSKSDPPSNTRGRGKRARSSGTKTSAVMSVLRFFAI